VNFYKHYIGDFQRDTGHLSLTERGAYLSLMHHYYATEKPLPNDHAALCRVAGALTKAERDAVRSAMRFFRAVDSGLMHNRIEAEIEKAGKQADTNRRIAEEREAKRKEEREAHEASTKRATNREPNQTPDTIAKKPPHSPPRGQGSVHGFPPGFERFWSAYPRKVAKDAAAKAFAKRKVDDALLAVMLSALARQRESEQWRKNRGQFIPHPATWLNEGRWLDESAGVECDVFAGAQ
jgi:uncharacterized protein YdaU (DUF1376 family)